MTDSGSLYGRCELPTTTGDPAREDWTGGNARPVRLVAGVLDITPQAAVHGEQLARGSGRAARQPTSRSDGNPREGPGATERLASGEPASGPKQLPYVIADECAHAINHPGRRRPRRNAYNELPRDYPSSAPPTT